MIGNLTKQTLEILTRAGWFPGRLIDRSLIERKIKGSGFLLFDSVIEFLCEFDGLYFKFFNKRNKRIDDFDFDFDKVCQIETPEKLLKDYIQRVGSPLCVVGTGYREHFILMLSSDGKLYGAYDWYLVLMGNNIAESLNAIVEDYSFIDIP